MRERIFLVEDEMIIAEDIRDILDAADFGFAGLARNYYEAIEKIAQENPDLILLDIKIKGEKDGVDVAQTISDQFNIPFVFISSHSDPATVKRAVDVTPYGYIVKPFEDKDVLVAIEVALSKFAQENHSIAESNAFSDSLFVKDKNRSVKIATNEIHYIQADGNYSIIQTKNRKYSIRATLKEIEPKLDAGIFFRCHKSFIVNLKKLTAIESDTLFVEEDEIPVGRNQLSQLHQLMNKL